MLQYLSHKKEHCQSKNNNLTVNKRKEKLHFEKQKQQHKLIERSA